jgi:WD40 repeat protein
MHLYTLTIWLVVMMCVESSADETSFQLADSIEISDAAVYSIVSEFPDAGYCLAATEDASPSIYRLNRHVNPDRDPLPFDDGQEFVRISDDTVAFLSGESVITWNQLRQTAKRLRTANWGVGDACCISSNSESNTVAIVYGSGLSVWSSTSLDLIWTARTIPESRRHYVCLDASSDMIVAGDVVGNFWKVSKDDDPVLIRQCSFAGCNEVTTADVPFLHAGSVGVVIVNHTTVAIVMRDRGTCSLEWWRQVLPDGDHNLPERWERSTVLELSVMPTFLQVSGTAKNRTLYMCSPTAVVSVNLQSHETADCFRIDDDNTPGHSEITSFSVSPDRTSIVTGHRNGMVRVWNARRFDRK